MTITASTALITGGTSGIGRAAANNLAQLGVHVLVVGRNATRGSSDDLALKNAAQREHHHDGLARWSKSL